MTRARRRRVVAGLAGTALLAPLAIGVVAAPASGKPQPHQHTICHATSSAKNPYVIVHPATAGVMHGHLGEHHHGARDIIPPFTYAGAEHSQNWDERGRAIHANGCAVPEPEPPLLSPPPAEEPPVLTPPPPPPVDEDPPVDEVPDEPALEVFRF
jgi:hypothetical protein